MKRRKKENDRTRYDTVVNMVEEVIHERLHIPTKEGTIRIADLGCSVGPNTLHSMRTVLDAIGAKIKRSSSSQDQDHGRNYEFQVSFNDRIGNDFNTLFEFLPPNRQYFVAAVPGSFYSRLFPQNSIHYFNSSLALHWLTRAPSGLINKGRVHCHGGGAEAVAAYRDQFRADMAAFLEARAVKLVPGGLLVMLFVCRHEWMDADAPRHDMWFPHIESILRELVAEALHWLSRAPSGLVKKGRVHCHGGGAEAVAAYGGQFMADIAAFLEARAVELVPGGLLVMLFVCRHEWMDADAPRHDMWFPHIESILRELVEGEVREEDLDSFQLPIYSPTVGEFREVVEMNGSYAIHVAEKVDEAWASNGVGKEQEERRKPDLDELARDMSRATRAVFEDIVGDHFGKDVAGEVFRRLPETVYQFFLAQPTMPTLPPTAFFVLQKKC